MWVSALMTGSVPSVLRSLESVTEGDIASQRMLLKQSFFLSVLYQTITKQNCLSIKLGLISSFSTVIHNTLMISPKNGSRFLSAKL